MPIDKEKFTDALVQIYEKRKQIKQIAQARRDAEQALVVQYNIAQCNADRAVIQQNADAQIQVLQSEINTLEASLGQ